MFSNLIIAYPYGFILLALLAGLVYASILYFRNKWNKISLFWTIVLFILRFVSVSMLAILLLSPFIKTKKKFIEKPIIVLGFDNSTSVVLGKDSVYYKNDFKQLWKDLPANIGEGFRIESYLFGGEVRKTEVLNSKDKASDYSEFITHVKNEYSGMNLGAVVLAGDGIYNKGVEPVFAATGLSIPFYTIALGDTNSVKDIKITDVRFNSLVYKDDIFPLEVSISADKLDGKQAKLVISAFGKEQETKRIDIISDNFSSSYAFKLKATEIGKHRIKIDILLKDDELNKSNNQSSIFIDVFNNAQKILIIANSPHPDISAFNQSLKSYQQYETEIAYLNDLKIGKLVDYDLLILHQVPSVYKRTDELFREITKLEIPTLFILGKQSSLPTFNQVFKGMDVLTSVGKFEEARPDLNPLFTRFSYDIRYRSQIEKLPPVITPLGNYVVAQNAEVFAYQRINNISTDFPLIVFFDESGLKSGAVAGEGIWMWRIHNYLNDGNFDAFDSFLNKTIQFLAAKKDKRFFRVNSKNEYNRSENVLISAELYNAAYETVSDAEVSLRLMNENGEQFNYLFSPNNDLYALDLKQLDVGVYSYTAQAQIGTDEFEAKGEFIVRGHSFESRKLKADHNLLYRMAQSGNGKMLYPDELSELHDLLTENQTLKNRSYFEEKLSGLNTMPLILGIILFLLSLEWFLRKYFGSY